MSAMNGEVLRLAALEIRTSLRAMPEEAIESLMFIMDLPQEGIPQRLRESGHGEYHGHGKYRFSKKFLSGIRALRGQDLSKVQAELVCVKRDLSHEIHHHKKSEAYVIGLGQEEHLPNAKGAQVYSGSEWSSFETGDRESFPTGLAHGFRVLNGGILYFLSLQSPPISGEGYDDYHY